MPKCSAVMSSVFRMALCIAVTSTVIPTLRAADPGDQKSTATDAQPAANHNKELAEERELIRLFADTLEQVRDKYVDAKVSDRELIEAAIQGMISRLDPYSNYISPEELDQFRKGVEHEFVGIGIQVSERDGQLQIISPLFGTPAWRAGLRAGDRILKINDASTRGLSIDDAIKLMGGDVGTKVSITVLHPDEKQAETVELVRELIQQPTVLGYQRNQQGVWNYFCDPDQRIAYVRIIAFSRNTSDELERTLKQLMQDGMKGLIVDLRFNPGGMLSEAIKVSDMFLHEGRIVSIEGRNTPKQAWDAKEEGTIIPRGFPVAVLVNHYSASAAEIVSACLQDNHVATIVGERTWGKGSVQNIIELEKGKSALKLTTAGYHRPSGKNIHRKAGATEADEWGVHPDEGFVVPLSRSDLENLTLLYVQRDALTTVGARKAAQEQTATAPAGKDQNSPDATKSDEGKTEQPGESTENATPQENEAAPADTENIEQKADAHAEFVDRQLEKALEAVRGKLKPTEPVKQAATDQ